MRNLCSIHIQYNLVITTLAYMTTLPWLCDKISSNLWSNQTIQFKTPYIIKLRHTIIWQWKIPIFHIIELKKCLKLVGFIPKSTCKWKPFWNSNFEKNLKISEDNKSCLGLGGSKVSWVPRYRFFLVLTFCPCCRVSLLMLLLLSLVLVGNTLL